MDVSEKGVALNSKTHILILRWRRLFRQFIGMTRRFPGAPLNIPRSLCRTYIKCIYPIACSGYSHRCRNFLSERVAPSKCLSPVRPCLQDLEDDRGCRVACERKTSRLADCVRLSRVKEYIGSTSGVEYRSNARGRLLFIFGSCGSNLVDRIAK